MLLLEYFISGDNAFKYRFKYDVNNNAIYIGTAKPGASLHRTYEPTEGYLDFT